MPRPRLKSRENLLQNAMWVFWTKGYYATSIDDLVKATGVARSGIYSEFGGKEEALTNCLAHYREVIADPAIAILHRNEDGLEAIRGYFDYFIGMHRKHGMPGPGCFMANVMTEVAPHCEPVHQQALAHKADLHQGFQTALCRAARHSGYKIGPEEVDNLATFLSIASQGLWSYARSMDDVAELDQFAREALALVETRLSVFAKANGSES
ncbi:MAG: TetR/AcrR family transcriptional regulator [Erythrobacter sp.]